MPGPQLVRPMQGSHLFAQSALVDPCLTDEKTEAQRLKMSQSSGVLKWRIWAQDHCVCAREGCAVIGWVPWPPWGSQAEENRDRDMHTCPRQRDERGGERARWKGSSLQATGRTLKK